MTAALLNAVEDIVWVGVYVNKVIILLGCVLMVEVSAFCIKKKYCRPNLFLAGSSFFLFAYHSAAVGFLKKLLWKLFNPGCDIAVLGVYFICVALTVVVGLVLYWGLKKTLPKFSALITGGR